MPVYSEDHLQQSYATKLFIHHNDGFYEYTRTATKGITIVSTFKEGICFVLYRWIKIFKNIRSTTGFNYDRCIYRYEH